MKSAAAESSLPLALFLYVFFLPITAHAIAFSAPIPIFDSAKIVEKESPDSAPGQILKYRDFQRRYPS